MIFNKCKLIICPCVVQWMHCYSIEVQERVELNDTFMLPGMRHCDNARFDTG